MTDEIKPETIQKTQELLGKFIKKPVLTEKLLTKPPFRFLHDICTAAMRETGFFEGVLSPTDCKVDSIKDKDGKIAFLQKVIAAVEVANGIKLAVKPNKVVAGHEPTRTNEFLQALGKALEKQGGRNDSVTKPKTDTSRKPEKAADPKTKTKTMKRPEKEESTLKKKTSSTKVSKPTDNKNQDSKSKSITPRSKQDIPKKSEKASPKEQETVSDKREEPEEEEKAVKKRERKLKTPALSNDSSELSMNNKSTKAKEKEPEEKVTKVEPEQAESERPVSAKPGLRKSLPISDSTESVPLPESPSKEPEPPKLEPSVSKTPDAPPKRPDSSFLRHNKQNSSPTSIPTGYATKDSVPVDDSSPISRPLTGMRPTTARPASARPAAPRIRDRGEITVHEDVIKQSTGNVQIITDKKEANETEEDENVVVVEPETELLRDELDKPDQLDSVNSLNQGEHGLLVEQILETQKELDQSRQQIMDGKAPGKTEIEWKSGRNREATEREIKKLRLSIQTLTKSANPLGKLLDFLQEDVDIMQKELANWQEMNASLDIQIAQERSLTDQSVEPLKIHLKELQQSIDEELDHMSVVKANILRNDQKIQRLLTEMK